MQLLNIQVMYKYKWLSMDIYKMLWIKLICCKETDVCTYEKKTFSTKICTFCISEKLHECKLYVSLKTVNVCS